MLGQLDHLPTALLILGQVMSTARMVRILSGLLFSFLPLLLKLL